MSIILNEQWNDLGIWTDGDTDTGVSEISPAGQLRLDTNAGAAGDANANRYKIITSPPDQFTIEIKTYFDDIGLRGQTDYFRMWYQTATWRVLVIFAANGLFIKKTGAGETEVGSDIVLEGGSAAWQIWRFQVDKSAGEDAATVEVFLDGVSQGTFDCDDDGLTVSDGEIRVQQFGHTTDNMVSHIDYIRIATGLGKINNPSCLMF